METEVYGNAAGRAASDVTVGGVVVSLTECGKGAPEVQNVSNVSVPGEVNFQQENSGQAARFALSAVRVAACGCRESGASSECAESGGDGNLRNLLVNQKVATQEVT